MSAGKYHCPACGFQIFNRRVRKCESCGGALPEELLFSANRIATLDAEHEHSRKVREARVQRENAWNGGGDGGGGSGDCGGDGGGGD